MRVKRWRQDYRSMTIRSFSCALSTCRCMSSLRDTALVSAFSARDVGQGTNFQAIPRPLEVVAVDIDERGNILLERTSHQRKQKRATHNSAPVPLRAHRVGRSVEDPRWQGTFGHRPKPCPADLTRYGTKRSMPARKPS
jgi:hypothetical protein